MLTRKFRLLAALLAVFALFLGACGDDDDSASTDDDTTQDESDATDDASDDTTDDTTDDTGADEDTDDGDGEVGIGDLTGECAFLGEFAETGFDEAFDGADPFSDGGESFQLLAEQFQQVADAAPGDIEEDFQTLAGAMHDMAEAFSQIDFSDPESIDPSVFEQFDEAEFEEAGERIEAWLEENCPAVVNG